MPGTVTDTFATEVTEGPGGCAANTAVDLALAGYQVTLFGNTIGLSDKGTSLRDMITECGITLLSAASTHAATPLCQVFVQKSTGQRCFALYHRDIELHDPSQLESVARDIAAGIYPVIFLQCYPYALATELLALTQIPATSTLITQDIEADHPLAPAFDIIQISRCESDVLDASEVARLAFPYFKGRCAVVVLTHGAKGLWLARKDQAPTCIPAATMTHPVVDTTGCGDAFRAGLMAALAAQQPLEAAVAVGAQWGAWKAMLPGSNFMPHGQSKEKADLR